MFTHYLIQALNDYKRHKFTCVILFTTIYTCLLCLLLIDVLIQNSSIIFIRKSERFILDALIKPSISLQAEDEEEPVFPHLNYTAIVELNLPKEMGVMSPRIELHAVDEITGASTGYHDKYGNFENWKQHFDNETGLPSWEEVYGPKANSYSVFRHLAALDTAREREVGIGEGYLQEPLGFGECLVQNGRIFQGEMEIFKFRFDYLGLAQVYNEYARENGLMAVDTSQKLNNIWTQIPCHG